MLDPVIEQLLVFHGDDESVAVRQAEGLVNAGDGARVAVGFAGGLHRIQRQRLDVVAAGTDSGDLQGEL